MVEGVGHGVAHGKRLDHGLGEGRVPDGDRVQVGVEVDPNRREGGEARGGARAARDHRHRVAEAPARGGGEALEGCCELGHGPVEDELPPGGRGLVEEAAQEGRGEPGVIAQGEPWLVWRSAGPRQPGPGDELVLHVAQGPTEDGEVKGVVAERGERTTEGQAEGVQGWPLGEPPRYTSPLARESAMDLPVSTIPLRGLVVYPGMMRPLLVGRPTSVQALEGHLTDGRPLVLVPQLDAEEEDPLSARLSRVGVLARVLRAVRIPDGSLRVLVEGLQRVGVAGLREADGALVADVGSMPEPDDDPIRVSALGRRLAAMFQEYLAQGGMSATDQEILAETADPERIGDQILGQLDIEHAARIEALSEASVERRLDLVTRHLAVAIASQRLLAGINDQVQAAMDKSQREYTLKEQLKIIRQELGDAAGTGADADAFAERLERLGLPEEVLSEAMREVDRLRRIHPDSAEYTITRTWLETVCELPWSTATKDNTSLSVAQTVLDEDHFGLAEVKERVLEYLAVRQLAPDSKGPILCFVGPPGVGKTSLGRSIARAIGRNYARVALGGIKDETEIRGHRRTYVGALPGRLIRALQRAGSRNPVIVLDEIDKVGNDFRGDPASALLEVLDPEQNVAFVDHYLDLPVDLSQVLFIATANVMDPIPPALMDRLEVIELSGYTEEDKLAISRRFLLPRLGKRHGLDGSHLRLNTKAIQRVIRDYTREAGVRELERKLATIYRKVARKVVEGRRKRVQLGPKQVPTYLGPQRYFQELSERVDQPGVVIGLAWTAAGGDILFIEAARMHGPRALRLTGSLGDVMKESAEAAMSWLRSHAGAHGLDASVFDADFHLHVPAGAIPKDGPSAGVSMLTALASLVTERPVRAHLAMTGEITLRGKVLPVGGVKEKVLAARRAGVKTVILPRHNSADLEDVPEVLRRDLEFHFVDRAEEVLELALA